jgi:hypothetical protein
MGQEAVCTARVGESVAQGKAVLESDEIIVRGPLRLEIPFASIRSVEAVAGELRLDSPDGMVVLELGSPRAERWAERIRNPRTLVDKLGIKEGARVGLDGLDDPAFLELLRARTDRIVEPGPGAECDVVFLGVEAVSDLPRVGSFEAAIRRDGGIWVVAPKGRKDVTEMDVLEAGRSAGLVDNKVARFSETHTAHKFVIPKTRR